MKVLICTNSERVPRCRAYDAQMACWPYQVVLLPLCSIMTWCLALAAQPLRVIDTRPRGRTVAEILGTYRMHKVIRNRLWVGGLCDDGETVVQMVACCAWLCCVTVRGIGMVPITHSKTGGVHLAVVE